jgi:hypothetical protein
VAAPGEALLAAAPVDARRAGARRVGVADAAVPVHQE